MERIILNVLDFGLSGPTCYTFLHLLAQASHPPGLLHLPAAGIQRQLCRMLACACTVPCVPPMPTLLAALLNRYSTLLHPSTAALHALTCPFCLPHCRCAAVS